MPKAATRSVPWIAVFAGFFLVRLSQEYVATPYRITLEVLVLASCVGVIAYYVWRRKIGSNAQS